MPVFRAKAGVVAVYNKALVGDPDAPFDDPIEYVDNILFHSDFQYLSNAIVVNPIDITHTLLAGLTGTGYSVTNGGGASSGGTPVADGQIRVSSIPLYTHNLGYAPLFQVENNRRIVSPGTVIQNPTGQLRMISAYATTTQVLLREVAISSKTDLPAWDDTYKLTIFKDPVGDPLLPTLWLRESGMILARGKVTDENRPLRRVGPDDDPNSAFYLPIDRTIDIKNGAIRNISPFAGVRDFGIYNGSFVSMSSIEVIY